MDLFPDRAHVRLRSRVRGTYLSADEDGVYVSLSERRVSPNTAWKVHRVQRADDVTYVLLHSAAYSRYLAHTTGESPRGHRGSRAIQRAYVYPKQADILWEAVREGDHVLLRDVSGRLLRANGRYRLWNKGVSVDDANSQSTMMHWRVERIPRRAAAPELPPPTPSPEVFRRIIVYVQADDLEHYDPLARRMCWFNGRSVSHLRDALANLLNEDNSLKITLCTRAGFQGRPIPLVVDLSRGHEPMFVIVLNTGSPAAEELVYPDVRAR